ncbi:MAG: penicillin-binding protein 1A [Thermochromatium sp.]
MSHWLFQILGSGLGAPWQGLTLAVVGAGFFVGLTLPELPDVQTLRNVQFQEPMRVYSADGRLIGEFGIERRRPVSIQQIPPLIIQSFLATEDSRFFEHRGIDTQGLGRALLSYLVTGEKSQGGSTISMQLTRTFFLSREKTFQRKLAEVLLTLRVEQTLTKEEILELYLNQIFFGHRTYGISAAAAFYYDKPLDRLTIAEAAMLAGIPKAPSVNNPITNPQRALKRRDYILGRMLELGYIDAEQYAAAIATPDTAQAHRHGPEIEADYVAEMARAEILRFYGEEAIHRGYRVTTTLDSRLQRAAQQAVRYALHDYDRRHGYRGPEATLDFAGLSEAELDERLDEVTRVPDLVPGYVTRILASGAEVYIGRGERVTLADHELAWARNQRNLERWRGQWRRGAEAVAVGDLVRLRRSSRGDWRLAPIPAVSGALVSLDPRDGAVRALVGGYAFSDSKFNRAVDMRRQPGSSFKPFVYAVALERGWTPDSLLQDESIRLAGHRPWNPKNADGRELGPISLRKALALSRNLASINLLQRLGVKEVRDDLRRFGFDPQALPLGLSMVLGTGELSPVKLAEGYAVFANGGYHVIPYFIQRIEDGDGQVIFEARPARACADCWYQTGQASATTHGLGAQGQGLAERVIDPRTAYQMTQLLREVIEHGTGTRAKRLDRPDVVGKTGTTNDIRDSWFAGYQAELVTVAWMGFDDFGRLGRGEEGGRAAIGMWVDFMEQALAGRPVATLKPPPGLVEGLVAPARDVARRRDDAGDLVQDDTYPDPLANPESVEETGPARGIPPSRKPRRSSASRVMDDLF